MPQSNQERESGREARTRHPHEPQGPSAYLTPEAGPRERSAGNLMWLEFVMTYDGNISRVDDRQRAPFWEGWARFWAKMTIERVDKISDLRKQVRELHALTKRPRLSVIRAREVASIRPTGPPALTVSSILAVAIEPHAIKPSARSRLTSSAIHCITIEPVEQPACAKLSVSQIRAISIELTEPTSFPELAASQIHSISIEPTKPPSSSELSCSPTPAVSIDPVSSTKQEEASLTCRKCHEVFPSHTALLHHAYSNCDNPVRLVHRAVKSTLEEAVHTTRTTAGRLVRKIKVTMFKRGVQSISKKKTQQDLKVAGMGKKLVRSPTRVTL